MMPLVNGERRLDHSVRTTRSGVAFWRQGIVAFAMLFAAVEESFGAQVAGGIGGQPLSSRSVAQGATMFTPMPGERTGVVTENAYADPRMWTDRYQELVYGGIGSGLAIGDFDNDGRPD